MKNIIKRIIIVALFTLLLTKPSIILAKTVNNLEELKEALSDTSVSEITLGQDIEITGNEGLVLSEKREVVLDLNGKTLLMESTKKATSYLIKNNGKLTIKDATDTNKNGTGQGKISYSSTVSSETYAYACNTISNYGILVLESGLIENNTPNAHADYCLDNYSNDSLIKMNGGKLFSLDSWGIRMFVNSNTKGNDLEINGGEIEGGVWLQVPSDKLNPKANITINNGKIYGKSCSLYAYDEVNVNERNINIKINGGEFTAANFEKGRALFINYDTHMNIEINGGTFTGKYAMIYYSGVQSDTPNFTINDGIFNGKIEMSYDFSTNQDENYNSNIVINNGKFSDDISVESYNEAIDDYYFSTNTKFIKNGYFAKKNDDYAWMNYVVGGFEVTDKMKTTPEGYPYTIGHKIILNSNYGDTPKEEMIYALKNGSMQELYNFSRDGYTFVEWNTKKDGTGNKITKNSKLNGPITLYAQWKLIPGSVNAEVSSSDKIKAKVDVGTITEAILTEAEKAIVEEGKNVKIEIVVNDITENIKKEEKEKIEKKIKDKVIASYIDISILKTVDGQETVSLTNTTNKVKLSISIPEELLDESKPERKFYIIRNHDGEVEILDSEYDSKSNTLTFETDKFSTYAIAYEDTDNVDNPLTVDTVGKHIVLLFISVFGIIAIIKVIKRQLNKM